MRESQLTFPTGLTPEEKHLKELFDKLRTIRRLLASTRGSGCRDGGGDSHQGSAASRRTMKRSMEEAAVATEEVKKKVKMGAITVNKVMEKSSFKRSKINEKQRRDSDVNKEMGEPGELPSSSLLSPPPRDSPLGFPHLSHTTSSESTMFASPSRRLPLPATRGSTLYVRGYDLMSDPLTKCFERYGTITRLNIEDRQKSAFITFESLEQADLALKEMDGNMVNGITLRVSYARRQQNNPQMQAIPSSSLEWQMKMNPAGGAMQAAPQPLAQTAWSEATEHKNSTVSSSPASSSQPAPLNKNKRTTNRSLVSYADKDDPFS